MAIVDPRITQPLDRHRLQQILLGQVTTWDDGSPIVLVFLNDPAGRAAVEELTGRDLDRLLRGWKRLVFSGSGAMPQVVDSEQQALSRVGANPGTLGVLGHASTDPAAQRLRTITTTK